MTTPSSYLTTLNGTINTRFTDNSTASGGASISGTSPSPQMPPQQLEAMRSELLQMLIDTTPPHLQNSNSVKASSLTGISFTDIWDITVDIAQIVVPDPYIPPLPQ
jgi:hypothetical protein